MKWFAAQILIALVYSGCASYKIGRIAYSVHNVNGQALSQPLCSDTMAGINGIKISIDMADTVSPQLRIHGDAELSYRPGETPLVPAYIPRALVALDRNLVVMVEAFPHGPDIFSVALITYVTRNGALVYSSSALVNTTPCQDAEITLTDEKGSEHVMKIRLEYLAR